MSLETQFSAQLDSQSVGDRLLADIAGPVADLDAVDFSVAASDVSGPASVSTDTSGIDSALVRLAERAAPLVSSLPGVGDVFGPLVRTVELVEKFSKDDVAGKLSTLGATLASELDGGLDRGLVSALLRVSEVLSGAQEGRALGDLLKSVLQAAHLDLPSRLPLGDGLQAADGGVRAFGGLMGLESVLAEAERLTRIMAAQVAVEDVRRRLASLERSFTGDGTPLASFVASVQPDDPPAVAAAVAALTGCATQLEAVEQTLSTGMGFGEATLVHLDVDKVLLETGAASMLVRTADTTALRRLATDLAAKVQPFVAFDLGATAARGLDQLLDQVELQIAELAGEVSALDVAALTRPIGDGIGALSGVIGQLSDVIAQITVAFRGAMNTVRDAVAALPLREIADAIRSFLEPITAALEAITAVIADVTAALDLAAAAVGDAIEGIDGVLDTFKQEIDKLFADAKAFVQQLNMDAVVGEVSNKIKEFADILARCQMKPYFDTAVDVIGTTADVIGALPLSLLPDSMKQDLDAAVRPIKETDARAVELEIEGLLQITEDGKFALNDQLRQATAEIQEQYEKLLETVREYEPRQYLQAVNDKLEEIAGKIRAISPEVELSSITQAVDRIKDAIVSFDLAGKLDPVSQVFDQIEAKIDELKPGNLVKPIQDRLVAARDKLLDDIKFNQWGPALDDLVARGNALLDRVSPAALQAQIESALGELTAVLDRFPDARGSGGAATILTALASGLGLRIAPDSFFAVRTWLGGASGTAALNLRASQVADAVTTTRDAVRALDLPALTTATVTAAQAVREAASTLAGALPDGDPNKVHLQSVVLRLDAESVFARLQANRQRYLATLEASAVQAETLRRTGFSEVDVTVGNLRVALSPLGPANHKLGELLRLTGLSGIEQGISAILRSLLAAAPPSRLAGLVMPLFTALRERLAAFVAAATGPIKDGITQLETLVAQIDLQPLTDAIDGVFDEVKQQVQALRPDQLLAEPLGAFQSLQDALRETDPVEQVLAIITGVRDAIAAILEKLDLEKLLESPLAIYDHIIGELSKLNVEGLLDPVFAQLDNIAGQVDEGLDATVAAFQQLQESLPGGSGGASASLSVGVG